MLKPNITDRDLAIQEMNIEIQILLKASHPNIINISGVGDKPRKFIVLVLLTGFVLAAINNYFYLSQVGKIEKKKENELLTGKCG